MNDTTAASLCLGRVLKVDFRSKQKVWITQFIRVRVEFSVSRPLLPGFFLPRNEKDDCWIYFQFERISDFCFKCGRLGHIQSFCSNLPLPETVA